MTQPPTANSAATGAPDWGHWLDPGETLIWTGRPAPGWRYTRQDFAISLFGVILLCVVLLLMITIVRTALNSTDPPALPVRGILLTLFITVSGVMLFGTWWMIAGHRRNRERTLEATWYALTKGEAGAISAGRALIRVTGAWPKLSSWPITARLILDMQTDATTGTSAIDLGDFIDSGSEGERFLTRTGFARLSEGTMVCNLIRQLQIASQHPPTPRDLSDDGHPENNSAPDQV